MNINNGSVAVDDGVDPEAQAGLLQAENGGDLDVHPDNHPDNEEKEQIENTLICHLCFYIPTIALCFTAFYQPIESKDPETAACQQDYKVFLLVVGVLLIPFTLFTKYMLCFRDRYFFDTYSLIFLIFLGVECLAFTGICIYQQILKHTVSCENTGTLAGEIALLPIFLYGSISTLFVVIVVGALIHHGISLLLNRYCCCFGAQGTAMIGSSLAKVPYDASKFKGSATECAICLNDLCQGENVSPLHCDIKHVFHTACIKQWLDKSAVCPFCKAEISATRLRTFNKQLKKTLNTKKGAQCSDITVDEEELLLPATSQD